MALDGNLVGNTVSGPRQQQQAPNPSSLSLLFQAQDISTSSVLPILADTARDSIPDKLPILTPADPFALDSWEIPCRCVRIGRRKSFYHPNLIGQSGFGSFSVDNSDGTITVPAEIELKSCGGRFDQSFRGQYGY